VFIGPPFAAMPFFEDLDYPEFCLTIMLNNHEVWTGKDRGRFHHKVIHSTLSQYTHCSTFRGSAAGRGV